MVVETQPHLDDRGYFARAFSAGEFAAAGLETAFVQTGLSHNVRRGTVRGMHFQAEPFAEVKLVRCLRGSILDVVVDLREGSQTAQRWVSRELSAENLTAMYVPRGCAHGFQTLTDDALVLYQIAGEYRPEAARGIRWDDAAIRVEWPLPVTVISAADRAWPDVVRLP
jgi:dTDP-4-dehydrorhamnose 3,5-epimerase